MEQPDRGGSEYQPFEDYQKNLAKKEAGSNRGPGDVTSIPSRPRTASLPDARSPGIVTASDIAKVGGFRREFIAREQEEAFDILPSWIGSDFDAFVEFVADPDWTDAPPPSMGRKAKAKLTLTQTCVTLFKAFIGPAILFIPKAMANAGWAVALCCMVISAILSTKGMLHLADCHSKTRVSYPGMGRRAFGNVGYSNVSFQIALSQFGFGCTGFIFEAKTLTSVIESMGWEAPPLWAFFILALCIKIPVGWIRTLHRLRLAAVIATLLMIAAVLYIFMRAFLELAGRGFEPHPTVRKAKTEGILTYIGTAVYMFEGIAMCIPIQQEMERPDLFASAFCFIIGLVATLLGSFSLVTYLAWGDGLYDIVLNQPLEGGFIFITCLKLGYVVADYLQWAFVMFPTFSIIEHSAPFHAWNQQPPSRLRTYVKSFLRTVLAVLATLVAYYFASILQIAISFIGVLCSIPLALWIPGGIHLWIMQPSKWSKWIDVILIAVGLGLTPFVAWADVGPMISRHA